MAIAAVEVLGRHPAGLLVSLMRHAGQVLAKTRIYESVWDDGYDGVSNTLEVHIMEFTSSASEQRPTIFWSPATGAAGYDIWVDNLSTNTSAVVRSTTVDTWFTPTMDLGIGQYAAWVRSVTLDGNKSGWSPRFTFKIAPAPVITPPNLILPTARPSISWSGLPGAARYDVWVDNLSTHQSQVVRNASVTGTSWSPTTDLPMGRYRIWVRGLDAHGV